MSAHYEQEQDANEEKLSELERQHKAKSAAVYNKVCKMRFFVLVIYISS